MSEGSQLRQGLVLIGVMIALVVLSVAHVRLQRQYETQRICDRSHAVQDGNLEKACGDIQDKYDTEYICDGFKADAFCWVELK